MKRLPSKSICLERIQSGDVILTSSPTVQAALIKFATKGPFSHVAVFVGHFAFVESTGTGVRRLGLKLHARWSAADGEVTRLGVPAGRIKHLAVYRHRNKPRNFARNFERAASQVLQRRYGLDYSPLARMTRLGKISTPLRLTMMSVAMAMDAWNKRGRVPGPFCSELVAEIYAAMGLQIMPGKAPAEVTPNDFAASAEFMEVKDVVLSTKDLKHLSPLTETDAYYEMLFPWEEDHFRAALRGMRLSEKRISEICELIEKAAKRP